jgi:hypothetical protein
VILDRRSQKTKAPPVTTDKSNRLGIRGALTFYDSCLRLLGGANATGALASGVAFHAFNTNAAVQGLLKVAAVSFLIGVLAFLVGYFSFFVLTIDMDRLVRGNEPESLEHLILPDARTTAGYKKTVQVSLVVVLLSAVVSITTFFVGLMHAIRIALAI